MRGAAALRPVSQASGASPLASTLDLVLADVDVVAVVQGGALDAEVVHESAV